MSSQKGDSDVADDEKNRPEEQAKTSMLDLLGQKAREQANSILGCIKRDAEAHERISRGWLEEPHEYKRFCPLAWVGYLLNNPPDPEEAQAKGGSQEVKTSPSSSTPAPHCADARKGSGPEAKKES